MGIWRKVLGAGLKGSNNDDEGNKGDDRARKAVKKPQRHNNDMCCDVFQRWHSVPLWVIWVSVVYLHQKAVTVTWGHKSHQLQVTTLFLKHQLLVTFSYLGLAIISYSYILFPPEICLLHHPVSSNNLCFQKKHLKAAKRSEVGRRDKRSKPGWDVGQALSSKLFKIF